ncbi:hypothetical protein ES703_78327 [subsurface metagenome]
MNEVERLYPGLNQRASEIVCGTLNGYYLDSYEAIAHDITVDFLLFSRSFKKTYRSIQGKLMPFFSSYVRKRLLGVRDKIFFHDNMFSKKDWEGVDMLGTEDETVDLEMERISLVLKSAQTYLVKHFSGEINLGRLFRLCFIVFVQTGGMSRPIIEKRLGCTEGQLKFALSKMRKILREKKDASDFCRV